MYCTPDCTCSLCRELRGFRPKLVLIDRPPKSSADKEPSIVRKPLPIGNDNFILRRRRFSEFNYGSQNMHQPKTSAKAIAPTTSERLLSCSTSNIVDKQLNSTKAMENSNKFQQPNNDSSGAATITKSRSCSDVWRRPAHPNQLQRTKAEVKKLDSQQHKVVIYFGDSLSSKQQLQQVADTFNEQVKVNPVGCSEMNKQFESGLVEKNRGSSEFSKPASVATTIEGRNDTIVVVTNKDPREEDCKREELPSFVESVENNVINIKIAESFRCALDIVNSVVNSGDTVSMGSQQHSDNLFDWSFVQEWRSR